ncbi:pirin family protein [Portibacter lacus]|uniref:Quercetin 2,3-dioxygenase n=1 Tax=Portibacter lacus TaxID=1099794 RepID=A0AA37SSA4_9BACT|nr:pirin family protein [Portibacter lacus]GLR19027.1 quercetin 2,3-dioxygenase [Portibacter lacus]
MNKLVKYLLPAAKIDMGGFPVKQALPTQNVPQVDPFLLLHHGKVKYSSRRPARHQGVDPHPHRGFSPVTFVVQGEVHHRDSRGNSQIAKAGEVQWIHAGAGIIHSERPSEAMAESGTHQEFIQIWINSPQESKMKIPEYIYIDNDSFKRTESEDGFIKNKVIDDIGQSPLLIIWAEGQKKGTTTYQIPEGYNSAIYLIKGKMRIKGFGLLNDEHLAVFEDKGDTIEVEMKEAGQFLILSGLPIDEKVVQSGPYVMNSETEILEAMRDYQMGKMGILIEE